ncbi:MAG: methionine--tRNA ligase [Candidatus Thorarchaeota archaeon]|nr:MAG: methionine--tRNA ligase [Candidatus Thorarchaeota archaeon]
MNNYPTKDPVLVTCGLPYASGQMHIGHLRTYVPADVFVRLLKKMRVDVTFVCGSDTHGTPVVTAAEAAGVSPKELYTKYHQHYLDTFPKLGINFDNYGTTDDNENVERTLQIVKELQKNGYIYPKELDSPYCDNCGRSLPDRYVRGECPHCHVDARGDECDQGCGRYLEPGEILNPRCAICGSLTRTITRTHYYFRLSSFEDFLKKYLTEVDGTKIAKNYALGWVNEGLKDWCITRDLGWGIPYPGDKDLTLYVWVDAPIHYMSSTEQWAKKIKKPKEWEKYWLPGNGRLVHYIGQDIVYHHCLFWPSMLKGSGYNLPAAIVASGMVKIEGHNFSRGRGYVVWILDDYLDKGLDPDYLRFYMVSFTGHTRDLDFSWDAFADKVNTELVGTLGNFVYRTLHFTKKNYGSVPKGTFDPTLKKEVEKAIETITEAVNEYELKKVSDEILRIASVGNEYFQANQPWALVKEDKAKCGEVLYNAIALVKALTILIDPIMPNAAETIWKQLGYNGPDIHTTSLDDALEPPVVGTEIVKPKPVISKIDDDLLASLKEIIGNRIKAAEAKEKGEPEMDKKELITFDDFKKLDLRAGKILTCEKVPNKDKLLLLEVDIGTEKRTIVTGLADQYKPEELAGMTALFLTNLEPKKIGGIESHGMILAVEKGDEPGRWLPVKVDGVPPGSKAA